MSVALTAGNWHLLGFFVHGEGVVQRAAGFLIMKAFAIAASFAIFFLIYSLLPNGKVPPRAVLPTSIICGMLWEIMKYAYMFALPWLNFQEVYGPFALSVSMMFWAFLSGLLLLVGAYLSAEGHSLRNSSRMQF
jgi:YihY family inner membrane protein